MHDAQELLNRTPEYTGEWERTHEHREWAHGGGTSPTHTADDVSEGRCAQPERGRAGVEAKRCATGRGASAKTPCLEPVMHS
jgi:hypothetical protein